MLRSIRSEMRPSPVFEQRHEIVHIREHLPILLGTRVTAFREPQSRKAAK